MWRCRHRRYYLTLLAVSLAWVVLIAAIVRFAHIREARLRTGRGAARLNVAIRTRQGVLPIRIAEVETLKASPLEKWSNEQMKLLNMTFRPWLSTRSDCSRLSTGFGRHLPTVALVSLPSSGNTWMRFLIEGGSGVFTGSLYSDLTIVKAGMYGELVPHDSGTTIAQKTHGFTTLEGVTANPSEQRRRFAHVQELGCRAILLVRDPAAAIVSHRHLDAAGHLGFAPQSHFEGEGWDKFVDQKAEFWYSLYAAWIDQCPPEQLLVVQYEKLKSQLNTELERVLRFLGVQPDPERMKCIERYPRGNMQRRTRANSTGPQSPLSDRHRQRIKRSVLALHRLVSEHQLGDGIADYL
ncbi:WSC domain-containing protein 1-like [Amphibalanus amphitrite]|uniref:WSC domain-containing protein 1-like n=1 Tax=Amphibalanus amphitrite TaxID=1232801 RepID=UPI001C902B63|nr:WSC domain-containing protein 1-like [Amphibalanus amphitrite]